MDREKAIDILVGVIETHSEEENEALDIAIEALQESADKYTKATTNLYNSRLAKDVMGISEEAEKLQLFGETSTTSKTETVDTPTNTPTNDCISRQDAIEAIEGVDWYHVNPKGELVSGSTSEEESWYKAEDIYEAIESLPSVTHDKRTETHGVCSDCIWNTCNYNKIDWEASEDYISRQLAIEEIKNATTITGWNTYASQEEIVDDVERELRRLFVGAIESLPPVTPPKKVVAEIKVDTEELVERIKEEHQLKQEHGRLIDADKLLQELFNVDEEEWTTPEIRAILENAPNITPTVSEDCISREWLINHFKDMVEHYEMRIKRVKRHGEKTTYDTSKQISYWKDEIADYKYFIREIENAPSVTPTERTREWKWESEDICDNCGYGIPHLERIVGETILMDSKDWKYCPNCGEKMKG